MNNTVDYYRKYLKYYTKYQELKKQLGGAKCEKCGSEDHETADCPQNSGEWTTVEKKTRPPKPKSPRKPIVQRSREEVMAILKEELQIYNEDIVAGYLYGSRAQNTPRETSDADVIVFWKRLPPISLLLSIRDKMEERLGFNVDLVSCWYVEKDVKYHDIRDKAYFDGVIAVAKQFIGEHWSIEYLTKTSVKQPKLWHPKDK